MRNIKKTFLSVIISLIGVSSINAQEAIPVYTDYLTDNYYLLHPSMAGASNCSKVRLSLREQWVGAANQSPSLQTLTFNTSLNDRSGIGAILFNDRNGYHSQMGAKLTYAHHINFSRNYYDLNRLSFGISGGMAQSTLDQSNWLDYDDPIVDQGVEVKDQVFMVDVGASYHYLEFSSSLTVKNAFSSKTDLYTDVERNNLRSYILSAAYTFGRYAGMNSSFDDGFTFEPSIMLQYFELTQQKNIDTNFKAYKKFNDGELFFGLSHRISLDWVDYKNQYNDTQRQFHNSLSPLMGAKYKNFMFGYTYSHKIGNTVLDNSGFHQVTLGFNFGCKEQDYKCSCPSVNF